MNRGVIALIVWAVAMVQGWFLSAINLNLLMPNLLLITLLVIAVTRSSRLALAMGLWGGLWLDLASNTNFGFNIFLYALIVLVIQALRTAGVEFRYALSAMLFCAIAVITINAVQVLVVAGSVSSWQGIGGLFMGWIAQSIATAFVAWIVISKIPNISTLRHATGRAL